MTAKAGSILVVGLGNPGKKFEFTRHNLGYRVLERLRGELGLPAFAKDEKSLAEVTAGDFGKLHVTLGRPLTFMNESGHAVARLKTKLKLATTKVWLVHDDKDLELGVIKVKDAGGSAGHKGVESVIEQLKTKSFKRYRLGILPPSGMDVETDKFVLAKFLPEEEPTIRLQVDKASTKLVNDLGVR